MCQFILFFLNMSGVPAAINRRYLEHIGGVQGQGKQDPWLGYLSCRKLVVQQLFISEVGPERMSCNRPLPRITVRGQSVFGKMSGLGEAFLKPQDFRRFPSEKDLVACNDTGLGRWPTTANLAGAQDYDPPHGNAWVSERVSYETQTRMLTVRVSGCQNHFRRLVSKSKRSPVQG